MQRVTSLRDVLRRRRVWGLVGCVNFGVVEVRGKSQPLSAFWVARRRRSRFCLVGPVETSWKDESAMLKCAFVGGLKLESRTKIVFVGVAEGEVERMSWNEEDEAAKDVSVLRRVGRREVISASSAMVGVSGG